MCWTADEVDVPIPNQVALSVTGDDRDSGNSRQVALKPVKIGCGDGHSFAICVIIIHNISMWNILLNKYCSS